MKRGKFSASASSQRLLESHKEHNASSLQMFVQEAFVFGENLSVKRSSIHPAYIEFCEKVRKKATGRNKFLVELEALPGITKGRGAPPMRDEIFNGIGWNPEFEHLTSNPVYL